MTCKRHLTHPTPIVEEPSGLSYILFHQLNVQTAERTGVIYCLIKLSCDLNDCYVVYRIYESLKEHSVLIFI